MKSFWARNRWFLGGALLILWMSVVYLVTVLTKSDGPGTASSETPNLPFSDLEFSHREGDRWVYEERHSNEGKTKRRLTFIRDQHGRMVQDGPIISWHENGQKQHEGQWLNGQREGTWIAWHENGRQWVRGEFSKGQATGLWRYQDEDGRPVGQRVDGVKFGRWEEWNQQRDARGSGEYDKGRMHGPWKFENSMGDVVLEVVYVNGVVDGKVTMYRNGPLEFVYENGVENPERRLVVHDGQEFRGDDSQYGGIVRAFSAPQIDLLTWIPQSSPFDPETFVLDSEQWEGGTAKKRIECKLVEQHGHVIRIPHGKAEQWYEDGNRMTREFYRDGFQHGTFEKWYPDGRMQYEIEFRWGAPFGNWRFWHPNGSVKAEGRIDPALDPGNWRFQDPDGKAINVPDVSEWLSVHFNSVEASH